MSTTTARTVLAVAAHADDETLGAGGTLAEHAAAGDRVRILVLSASSTSRPGHDHAQAFAHRSACVHRAAAPYNARAEIAAFDDNAFDTVPRLKITQAVENAVRTWVLHRRYERKVEHFLRSTGIACTLICLRRLTR